MRFYDGPGHYTRNPTQTVLSGEIDIHGQPFDVAAWAAASAAGQTWMDGTWNGVEWTGGWPLWPRASSTSRTTSGYATSDCAFGQGFFMDRPLAEDVLADWGAGWRRRRTDLSGARPRLSVAPTV